MKKNVLLIVLSFVVMVAVLSGCVSTKKYQKLESDHQRLRKVYDEAQRQLDEKDSVIAELQKQIEEQKAISEREIALLKKTNDELVANLKKEISTGKIQIEQIRGSLTMSIAEELFFESGKTEIKPQGQEILKRIGAILKKNPEKNVRVEGHTDSVPIGRKIRERYPTNWELGATRAVNVVRFLQEGVGMDPLRLSAVSYGQYRPRATNRTEAGRVKNRRIEIILIDRNLDLAKKMRENLAIK
jgi:chemotaxis protein MotB